MVLSLWSVDDRSTKDLMVGMYRRIAKGEPPQQALLAAQRAYVTAERAGGRYPHPFYWAAFVASGTALEAPK